MGPIEAAVYFLCFITSSLCAGLLLRAWRRARGAFLVWSALCFCMLALNNLLVFVDIVLLPAIDLSSWRLATALAAICLLLYGFVWEL